MSRRRLAVAAAVAITCATGTAVLTDQAQAQDRRAPSVTITTLTPHISVGTGPKFRYSATGLHADWVVQLIRKLADNTWKVVATPPQGANLMVTAPAVGSPAKYIYRMRAVDAEGHTTVPSGHDHPVLAYGNISIATLCPHTVSNPAGPRVCRLVHTTVGGTTVDMHMGIGSQVYPNYFSSARFPSTSCRSAALRFTTKTSDVKSYLKLVQGTQSHVASTPPNTLGHLTVASLTSAQLFFDASVQSASGGSVYLDGTMSCWTTTGIPT